jgi:ParB family chromosome partitioning protein
MRSPIWGSFSFFLLDHVDHRQRGGAADRMAGVSAAQPAGRRRVHDLRAPDHAGQDESARKAFGHGYQVG